MSRPQEFYGHSIYSNANWPEIFTSQHCPYTQKRCSKIRKSESNQTIGTCSVEHQNRTIVTCPHRFLEHQTIFHDAAKLLTPGDRCILVPEFNIPGGHVDYLLVSLQQEEIRDYVGIEIQSLDTTNSGSLWECRRDLESNQMKPHYQYGINWKDAAKRSLVQLLHKVHTFEQLHKKIVMVVQTEFFQYLSTEFTTTHLSTNNLDRLPAHFHVYEVGSHHHLSCRYATNSEGIQRLLNLGRSASVTEREIVNQIQSKLERSVSLAPDMDVPRFVSAPSNFLNLFEVSQCSKN